VCGVHPQ
jgi:hypothetical protein